ncbi:MAG: phage holin family protein [Marmoricola sp.]
MRFVVWIIVNVLALGAAIWLFDGITLTGDNRNDRIVALVIVGGIFGIITSFVKPVVKLLSLPFIIVTLGLLLLVINALMLLLTSKIATGVGLGFHVAGFWTAVWASIVISIVSAIVGAVLPDPDD